MRACRCLASMFPASPRGSSCVSDITFGHGQTQVNSLAHVSPGCGPASVAADNHLPTTAHAATLPPMSSVAVRPAAVDACAPTGQQPDDTRSRTPSAVDRGPGGRAGRRFRAWRSRWARSRLPGDADSPDVGPVGAAAALYRHVDAGYAVAATVAGKAAVRLLRPVLPVPGLWTAAAVLAAWACGWCWARSPIAPATRRGSWLSG
jgi:hypothetical protein